MAEGIKGTPVRVFQRRQFNELSPIVVDCRGSNAVNLHIIVQGTSPSAVISIEGGPDPGGPFIAISDPNASATITASDTMDSNVGESFVRVRIASISGTFPADGGYTVTATPYVAGGQSTLNVTNTASQNLAQIGGVAIVAAAALADDTANPTTGLLGVLPFGFDGATWDRLRTAGTGNLLVALQDLGSNTYARVLTASDGFSNATVGIFTVGLSTGFNNTTWDRWRNNLEGTVLASAARTATTNSADQTNYNARGVIIHFDITAVPTVETVTLTVTARSPIDGTYETLLTGVAEVAVAKRAYLIYPGAGAAANGIDVVNGFPLPRTWRVTVTHSAAGSFTYSVGYQLIL